MELSQSFPPYICKILNVNNLDNFVFLDSFVFQGFYSFYILSIYLIYHCMECGCGRLFLLEMDSRTLYQNCQIISNMLSLVYEFIFRGRTIIPICILCTFVSRSIRFWNRYKHVLKRFCFAESSRVVES